MANTAALSCRTRMARRILTRTAIEASGRTDTASILKATDNDKMGMGRTHMGKADMAAGLLAMGSVRMDMVTTTDGPAIRSPDMDMATDSRHILMASRDTAMAVVARDSRKQKMIGVGKSLFVYE